MRCAFDAGQASNGPTTQRYELIDVTPDEATVMTKDGDTIAVPLTSIKSGLREAIQAAFDAEDGVLLELQTSGDSPTILRIAQ